ncbi:MAG: GNAT family N-acetyltransferase [Wolbachia pipientis]|jgi:GNAT superfamily N-acetyltransferase|nr:GNAT family N-acetyltransferase [Wolbachia pipientis]
MSCIDLNKQEIIKNMENNIYKKLQYIPSKITTMSIGKIGQTLLVSSGMPSDTFNTAYGGVITSELADNVMKYYLNEKMPMAWWIGPSSAQNSNLEVSMKSAGFVHDELDVGMYCDLQDLSLDEYSLPAELFIKQCVNAKDFADFGDVLASIFDPVDEHVKMFYRKVSNLSKSERVNLKLFIGYVDDKPVSTGGLFLTEVAGIYDISTRPEMQKKGYGSAMFYTSLKFAKNKGVKYGVLQASQDGLNIYKRFGFEEICEFNVWNNKDRL